jgi:uncharacterized protein (DUF58 family)
MFVFILILLLLAAIFGVLGAVLKVAAVLILSAFLAVAVLAGVAWWALKRKARQIQRDYDAQRIQGEAATSTGTTVFVENEADPGELPARDDRY